MCAGTYLLFALTAQAIRVRFSMLQQISISTLVSTADCLLLNQSN